MQGKIVKGIAGFYYIAVVGSGVYECKARGVFRKDNRKPLVGDLCEIEVLSEEKKIGNLVQILSRKNELIRPAVANVDGALVVCAFQSPKPNRNLLDRFLISMEYAGIPTAICFNKADLISDKTQTESEKLMTDYRLAGYPVFPVSVKQKAGIEEVKNFLKGKTVTVAGPSGVGKSSLINELQSKVTMETGSISEKIDRGKHTTRHSELIAVGEDAYIFDTPGFSSVFLPEIEAADLWKYFPEFIEWEPFCRFQGCMHIHEPDCAVKEAVEKEKIARCRYQNYTDLYQELKNRNKY